MQGRRILFLLGHLTLLPFISACGAGSSSQSSAALPPFPNLVSVAYGKGIFVAVGDLGGKPLVETSTDGISWTTQDSGDSPSQVGDESFIQVVAGSNGFLIYDLENSVYFSSNGVNWVNVTAQLNSSILPHIDSIAWDGSEYLIVTDAQNPTAAIYKSPDGSNWTYISEQGSSWQVNRDIVKAAGTWYGIDDANLTHYLVTSVDLAHWVDVLEPTGSQFTPSGSFAYIGQQFIGIDSDGLVGVSTDAINWTSSQVKPNNSGGYINEIVSNGPTYVGVGGLNTAYVAYSIDGKTWNETDISKVLPIGLNISTLKSVAAQPNGAFVAVGYYQAIGETFQKALILVSMDGIHWSAGNP